MSQETVQVAQLYVALFGRAPDADGLAYWSGLLAQGQSVTQVANSMFGTTPARAYFPDGASDSQVVSSFYLNVLGRQGDAQGLAFWTNKLSVPGATRGSVIAEMVNVVANYTGNDPAGLASAALYNNRSAAALFYGENGGSIANSTNVLAGVTANAGSVAAARSIVIDPVAGSLDVGGYSDITLGWFNNTVILTNVTSGATVRLLQDPALATLDVRAYDATGVDSLKVMLPSAEVDNGVFLKLSGFEELHLVSPDNASISEEVRLEATPRLDLVTVEGGGNVYLWNSVGGFAPVDEVEAADFTGALVVMAGPYTFVTGGAGSDFLIGGGAGGTIEGYAGNDTLRAFGQITLVGGTGADVFDVSTDGGVGIPIIADFEKGIDYIAFHFMADNNGFSAIWHSQAISLGAGAILGEYMNAAVTGSPQYASISWFQFAGDTYIVVDNSPEATYQAGTDGMVRIVGIHDLSTLTYSLGGGYLG